MNNNRITCLLLNRDESALSELAKQYSEMYKGIFRSILQDERDVEECSNDLLLSIWNSIPPNRPDSLPAYICRIARNIGINKYNYNNRQKRASGFTVMLSELDDCIPDSSASFEQIDSDEQIRMVLSDFIRELDAETRILFVRRYIYLESTANLAKRFGISESHVLVKLFRARKKLKKRLEKAKL